MTEPECDDTPKLDADEWEYVEAVTAEDPEDDG